MEFVAGPRECWAEPAKGLHDTEQAGDDTLQSATQMRAVARTRPPRDLPAGRARAAALIPVKEFFAPGNPGTERPIAAASPIMLA